MPDAIYGASPVTPYESTVLCQVCGQRLPIFLGATRLGRRLIPAHARTGYGDDALPGCDGGRGAHEPGAGCDGSVQWVAAWSLGQIGNNVDGPSVGARVRRRHAPSGLTASSMPSGR